MNTLEVILDMFNLPTEFDIKDMPVTLNKFSRGNFATFLGSLGFTVGAEVGVGRGKFSAELCASNANLKLYCIDPWTTFSGAEPANLDPVYMEELYRSAKSMLSQYNCEIIRKISMDAVKDFPSESLDFVYIDGNHAFDYVIQDIVEWEKRVKKGGIVSGHDYTSLTPDVIAAVNAHTKAWNKNPWFIFNASKVPSSKSIVNWMWVK